MPKYSALRVAGRIEKSPENGVYRR